MDAKRTSWIFCAGLLTAVIGCTQMTPQFVGRPAPAPQKQETPAKSEPARPSPAVSVPAAPAAEQGDPVDTAVQSYIERIDGVERRASRPVAHKESATLVAAETPTRPPADSAQNLPVEPRDNAPTGEPESLPAVSSGEPNGSGAGHEPAVIPPAPTTKPAPPAVSVSPPALSAVTVRTGPAVEIPPSVVEPIKPGVNTPVAAKRVPTTLREFLNQWPTDAENAPYRQQLDRRVLSLLAGDYDEARRPLTSVSAEQQEIASRFIESLITIREEHDGDPAGAASRVLENLDALAESLRTRSELRIPTLAICQEVTGFGGYRPIDPPVFAAGVTSEFVAYCEVRDFVREQRDDGLYHSAFEMRTRVLNSAGDAVLDLRDADITDSCRQQRHDCFIPRLVQLPATLSPGEYVVKVTVVDKLGEKVAENRANFRIAAGP